MIVLEEPEPSMLLADSSSIGGVISERLATESSSISLNKNSICCSDVDVDDDVDTVESIGSSSSRGDTGTERRSSTLLLLLLLLPFTLLFEYTAPRLVLKMSPRIVCVCVCV